MREEINEPNPKTAMTSPAIPEIDRFRSFIFPNNIRKYRKARRIESLLQLSQLIASTTYIRLSKIERGEIFARSEEMKNIAAALNVDPDLLFLDIDDPHFDIAHWAADHMGPGGIDEEADTLAVLLAAAMRARRARDEMLTIAVLERDFGIAPVILSRVENAFKPLDRWSPSIQDALFRLFQVKDAAELTAHLHAAHAHGDLDAVLPIIANPADRIAKTRAKIRTLRAEVAAPVPLGRRRRERERDGVSDGGHPYERDDKHETSEDESPHRAAGGPGNASLPLSPLPLPDPTQAVAQPMAGAATIPYRLAPLYGAPLHDGLIAYQATGDYIAVPPLSGPRTYGLRIFRPSLGAGLPGRSVLIVDPDRFPSPAGLAVLREAEGLRLLSVTTDRQGRMIGYSEHPNREIALDELDPKNVASVIAAQFE